MTEINIEKCVQDSIKFFCSTPPSILSRRHEGKSAGPRQVGENLSDDMPDMVMGGRGGAGGTKDQQADILAKELVRLLFCATQWTNFEIF